MGDVVADMSMSLDGFVADRYGVAAAIAATQAAAGDPVRLHERVITEHQGATRLRDEV